MRPEKKKKRRRAIYHRRAMAVNPTLFLSPFFLSNHAARFHETFFWPSIIDLYRVISSNDFLNSFSFFLNSNKYPDIFVCLSE